MKTKILLAWIGFADLKASRGELDGGLGPIGQAVKDRPITHLYLLADHDKKVEQDYLKWIGKQTEAQIKVISTNLTSPTNFTEIYEAARALIEKVKKEHGSNVKMTYHVSPGTPAMAAVWIILSKTSHPAEIIESSPEKGVNTVSFPFDLAADYLPDISIGTDDDIMRLALGLTPDAPEFSDIVHRSKVMRKVVMQAQKVALHDVPVIIQGESGTGKELFAKAIHATSSRKAGPFVAVNCGAIPDTLVESELFGHKKGAFTGADQDRAGYLEEANGGTLFLDEIGELPLQAQVKILRSLQEGSVQRLGTSKPKIIDIRVIAATNRNLIQEVGEGKFREDLFHRLAVGYLKLPPLRERKGDLTILIDYIMDSVNEKFSKQAGWRHKNISAGAKNVMQKHSWPGNVRELYNTISRAALWSANQEIQADDIREAILPITQAKDCSSNIMAGDIGEGVDLEEIIGKVVSHYIDLALKETGGNKTKAAELLGLSNYQTLTNWMKKYL